MPKPGILLKMYFQHKLALQHERGGPKSQISPSWKVAKF